MYLNITPKSDNMSEIPQDLYHEILDSLNALKSENTIYFDQRTIKNFGIDNRSAYSMKNAKEDIIEYFMVSPNTPLTDINSLNEFMNNLLPNIQPTQKNKAEPYNSRRLLKSIFTEENKLEVGQMICEAKYYLFAKENETDNEIKIPFNIKCIIEIFPNKNYLYSGNYEWDTIKQLSNFEERSNIPWPLK